MKHLDKNYSSGSGRVPGIRLFEEALPGSLFERLARAIRSTGVERLKKNYTTTFWFPRDGTPTNVAEECIVELLRLVEPGDECVGMEWWLGRLRHGKKLRFHFDRDMTVEKETGRYVHPLHASALYLNDFPSSPMVILNQVPGPDSKSRVPEKPKFKETVQAVSNRYVVFPGNLRHGVVPDSNASTRADRNGNENSSSELRLSFLVNYWHRRPLPPVCTDYDGTVYASLRDRAPCR